MAERISGKEEKAPRKTKTRRMHSASMLKHVYVVQDSLQDSDTRKTLQAKGLLASYVVWRRIYPNKSCHMKSCDEKIQHNNSPFYYFH